MIRVYVKRVGSGADLSKSAYSLLDLALDKETGKGLSAYTLKREKKGKPYFEEGFWHFNISHSGAYVCCALSDAPVGIDIQTIKKISPSVMKRFFSCDVSDPRVQTRMWARYESIGKQQGCGIPHDFLENGFHFIEKDYTDACLCVCTLKKDGDVLIFDM